MNGVIAKSMGMVLGENGWQWPTEPPISLTHDYLIPTANLFRLSPAELADLDQRLFEQGQFEGGGLKQMGAAYMLRWNETRCNIKALRAFIETHKSYNYLSDGARLCQWSEANGQVINAGSLRNAFVAIRALDEVKLVEPPTITTQPADQAVMAGEPPVDQPGKHSFIKAITVTLGPDPTWSKEVLEFSPYTALYQRHGSTFNVCSASLDSR